MTASPGDTRAGAAYIELYMRDKVSVGIKQASAKLKEFSAGVVALGAGMSTMAGTIAGPILLAARSFSKVGDDIEKMSRRTGLAIETVSALGFAAGQSGTDMAALEIAVKTLQKNITELNSGAKESVETFRKLGLSVQDLKSLSPEDQFKAIAKQVASIEDPALRAGMALNVFGKSGTAILPLIADMDALAEEANDLGIVLSEKDGKAAAALNDAIGRMHAQFQAVTNTIAASVTPLLLDVANALKEIGKQIIDFLNANRETIPMILKLSAALSGLAVVVTSTGVAIAGLGYVMQGFVLAIPAIIGVGKAFATLWTIVVAGSAPAVLAVYRFTQGIVATAAAMAGLEATAAILVGSIAALAAVAYVGFKFGEWIGEVTGLTKAFGGLIGAVDEVIELSQDEADLKVIESWREQLKAGSIDAIEFSKRIKALEDARYKERTANLDATSFDEDEFEKRIQLAKQRFDFEQNAEKNLVDIRIRNIDDVNKRAMAEINERYNRELENAKKLGANIVNIEKARQAEIVAVRKAQERQYTDEMVSLTDRFIANRTASIQNDLQREIQLIRNRYDQEIRAAGNASEKIQRLEQLKQMEIENATNAEDKRRQESVAQYNKNAENTVQDLELEANYKGFELEEKKLELAKRRALEEAKVNGTNFDFVEQEYILRKRILDAEKAAESAKVEVAGTVFSNVATIMAQGGANPTEKRIADATEETAKEMRNVRIQLEKQAVVS